MEIRITLDDQTFTSMRSWLFRRRTLFVLAGVGATLPVLLYATTYTKPHTFVAGTTISSSQVNANFDGVYAAVNAHRAELDALESQAADVDGPFTHSVVFDYTGQDATFTVPEGVSRIRVEAWGGGGAGGCADSFSYSNTKLGTSSGYYSGGGGGAGAYGLGDFDVAAGQTYSVKVGVYGYHEYGCQSGYNSNGGESSFGALVVAGGGVTVNSIELNQTYLVKVISVGGAGGTSQAPFSVAGEKGGSSGMCIGASCASITPGGMGGSAFAGGVGGRSNLSHYSLAYGGFYQTADPFCTPGTVPGGGGGGAGTLAPGGCSGGAGRVVVYY